MRVPLNNIYRAFPELDRFTDDQCERLMQRVRLDSGGKMASTSTGLVVYFGLLIALTIVGQAIDLPLDRGQLIRHQTLIDLSGLILVLTLPLLPALLLRDTILRRQLSGAINRHLERIKCLDCSYLLIGQVPREQTVTCPECGRVHSFGQLGITAADLLPPTHGAALPEGW